MITQRQQDTLDFIRNYIADYGKSPLISEIAEGLGISSVGTTHRHVNALIDSGLINRESGRERGLSLIGKTIAIEDSGSVKLPVLGKIAAGRLIEAIADESEIDLGGMFAGKDRFALKINGESMIDKGILDGDYVVIQSQRTARHGDIVVALVDGYDATLKTLLLNDDGTITLMPANVNFEPITIEANRLAIQGVVVGQMRTYP